MGARTRVSALLAAAVAAAAGCGGDSVSPAPAATRTEGSCNVTLANHSVPPWEHRRPGDRNYYLGNGKLWTLLWPRGVVVVRRIDVRRTGVISMKFPWWRARGKLKITGRRLDAPAARLRAHIPSGYGRVGFQSTALIFPTEGCWEVTGHVGDARLTFVTLVRVKR
jgi:hypothetical protein